VFGEGVGLLRPSLPVVLCCDGGFCRSCFFWGVEIVEWKTVERKTVSPTIGERDVVVTGSCKGAF